MAEAPKAPRRRPATRRTAPKTDGTPAGPLLNTPVLADYFANRGVTEVVIVELRKSQFRLEVLLNWRATRSAYTLASGEPRIFGSVDACLRIIKVAGVGDTPIRIELKT